MLAPSIFSFFLTSLTHITLTINLILDEVNPTHPNMA